MTINKNFSAIIIAVLALAAGLFSYLKQLEKSKNVMQVACDSMFIRIPEGGHFLDNQNSLIITDEHKKAISKIKYERTRSGRIKIVEFQNAKKEIIPAPTNLRTFFTFFVRDGSQHKRPDSCPEISLLMATDLENLRFMASVNPKLLDF